MKRLALFIIGCLAMTTTAHAVDIDYSNEGKISVGLKLGMSLNPSFDAEINIGYRPFRYIGANVGLLLITPFNCSDKVAETLPLIDNQYKEIKDYKQCFYRTAVKAGVQFTTPAVMLTKGEMGLSLRFSPGIIMPFPTNKSVKVFSGEVEDKEIGEDEDANIIITSEQYYENSGAKFCYWYGRAELVLEYEENWEFTVGYTYSNFDICGGSRNITINEDRIVIGEKENYQSFTLGFNYKF